MRVNKQTKKAPQMRDDVTRYKNVTEYTCNVHRFKVA